MTSVVGYRVLKRSLRRELSMKIAEYTLRFRHLIVKVVAPKLYLSSIIPDFPRPMIRVLEEHFGKQALIGVEMGVSDGRNAESILETLNVNKLFLVDPYIPYVQDSSLLTEYVSDYPLAKERLSKFADKVRFIRKTSRDAFKDIPHGLDFVYIDGNHEYGFVKDDIQRYYEKVKNKGIIGGHDFNTKFLGVIKAVTEFAHDKDLEFDAERDDWWIVKK